MGVYLSIVIILSLHKLKTDVLRLMCSFQAEMSNFLMALNQTCFVSDVARGHRCYKEISPHLSCGREGTRQTMWSLKASVLSSLTATQKPTVMGDAD